MEGILHTQGTITTYTLPVTFGPRTDSSVQVAHLDKLSLQPQLSSDLSYQGIYLINSTLTFRFIFPRLHKSGSSCCLLCSIYVYCKEWDLKHYLQQTSPCSASGVVIVWHSSAVKVATHCSCNPPQLGGGNQRKNLFSWSNLSPICRTATNRKELRSSLRHFCNRPAAFCVTCVVACVLAGWRCSALPVCSLGVHQRQRLIQLSLQCPPEVFRATYKLSLYTACAYTAVLKLVELGASSDAQQKTQQMGFSLNQEHSKDKGGQAKRKRAKVRESSSPKSEHDSELSWERKGSQRDEECGEK